METIIMSKIAMAVLFLLAGFINVSAQQPAPMLYGRLAVNQTHIVFTYAGDLWSVERGDRLGTVL